MTDDEEYLNKLHGRVVDPCVLDLGGRQTRRVGVHFHEDERARRVEKEMRETVQASLGDLLKAQGDISYVSGVKGAVDAVALLFVPVTSGWGTEKDIAPWLAHVVARSPNCTCAIATDYDGAVELEYCPWYDDRKNQHLWYLAYHGLTEEEYAEQVREEQRQKAEAAERRAAARRQAEYEQLRALAAKFDVDPKYLP